MYLITVDWIIIGIFFAIVLGIGWVASYTAGKNTSEFFLGGRGMPWWLLGISMVACTFSADTPNLVTGMVRENGVAKNWAWWAFLITGMVTVFIYAKLWRRSKVMTDLGFYELRYSGKAASFLRGFRSLYLGLFFNCLIMGSVTLAAIKIGSVMLGLEPWVVVVGASLVVVIYASLGGIKGVIWADFFQYSIAMFGAVYAAIVAINHPKIGSLSYLLSHPSLTGKLSFFPDLSNPSVYVPLLIIPIAVQWWAVWYPGAEPGGGGYIAQRMLAAKNEKNAIGATLLFNFAHYAIRPWPWIIVALASIVIYPDLASIKAEFPHISDTYLKDDIAYPVMLSKLGPGWLGLVVASLIAAYMSTIGTHLNWGSSYIVNDFYKRFVKPEASEKDMVRVGRITTVLLMVFAGFLALTLLDNATQAFNILLLSGAGSGAIYLLRWFWWRINAWSEISAMIVATIVGIILVLFVSDESVATGVFDGFTVKLLISVSLTTITWIVATFVTPPVDKKVLRSFYRLTLPGGPGWKKVVEEAKAEGDMIDEKTQGQPWEMPAQILMVFVGCIIVYSSLFSIGNFLYGNMVLGIGLAVTAFAGTVFLFMSYGKMRAN
jgi:solute:Na+ symporter, SSS family